MKSDSKKKYTHVKFAGLFIIAIGIIFNEWTLSMLISPDGVIRTLTPRLIIWISDLILIITGIVIIKYDSYVRARGKEIIFSVLALIIFIIVFEGVVRTFYYMKNIRHGRDMNFSEYVGWQSEENQSWKRNVKGYGEIVFSTSKYGFRVFGDINTSKTKIFVIGDSYTHGTTVSDGNLYYDYLKKNHTNIEIFTYGAGGYATLQEYMILDKFFDEIKPDLILWQFCSNDIINNIRELESLSYINNNHMMRPYYDYKNGNIKWLYPNQDFGWVYKIVQNSYMLKLLTVKLDILKAERLGTIEDILTEDHQLAMKAVNTTSAIMGLVRKRVGNIPIVAFPVDKEQLPWSSNAFSNISKKYSIHYIDHVPDALEEARAKGITIDAETNPHWNDVGHSIVGKVILKYLIENNLLDK